MLVDLNGNDCHITPGEIYCAVDNDTAFQVNLYYQNVICATAYGDNRHKQNSVNIIGSQDFANSPRIFNRHKAEKYYGPDGICHAYRGICYTIYSL